MKKKIEQWKATADQFQVQCLDNLMEDKAVAKTVKKLFEKGLTLFCCNEHKITFTSSAVVYVEVDAEGECGIFTSNSVALGILLDAIA